MKKKLTSLLVASLMVSMLGACQNGTPADTGSSSANSGTSSSSTTGSSQEPSSENTEPLSVDEIYWFSTVSGFGPANWNTDDSPATRYIQENFGIKFKFEQPPTDADTKLGLMIATGDLPDMITVSSQEINQQLIDSGKMWTMEDLLNEYDPDSWLLRDYPNDAKQALIAKYGGWYSIPSHLETTDNREVFPPNDPVWVDVAEKGSNSCIMFNKDMMDALGITEEMVSTESGFYEACEIVKNSGHLVDGQSVIPVMFHCNSWIGYLDDRIAGNFGAMPLDAEGNYQRIERNPLYKNALKFMNTCIRQGYADVNTLTIDETAMGSYLSAMRVFCWIGGQAQQDKTGKNWVSFGPILADNGARPVMSINQSASTGWLRTHVSKDAKQPDKIAKLLSWITSREGLLMHYYGVEDVDYTIDDKGVVTRTTDGAQRLADDYRNNMLLWPFANTSFERNTEPLPDPTSNRGVEIRLMPAFGTHEKTYLYNSALIDFTDTLIEPSSDLGIQLSQMTNYLESQKAKIITATTADAFEAEYNNMISTMEGYRVADIDAEYNKVYQENCTAMNGSIDNVNASLN